MSLSDIANLSTLASAVAVLISVIYLSLQVRQAEKNQRSVANQAVATRATDIVMFNAEPHIVILRRRVLSGDTDFTADELLQLSFVLRVSLLALQDSHMQHKAGVTNEEIMQSTIGGVRPLLAQPVNRALWRRMHQNYPADFSSFVDKLIAETPVASPVDFVAQFKADLANIQR